MLQGVCVDPGQSGILQKGTSYHLFPNGENHYYVSKFPNRNAHKGCFQTKYFQIIEKESWPEEPEARSVSLDPEKLYKAKLIWRKPFYETKLLEDYYIKPMKTHAFFFRDKECKDLAGCFQLHWFTDFREVEFEEIVTEMTDFVIEFEESEQFLTDIEPKIANYVQLSFF